MRACDIINYHIRAAYLLFNFYIMAFLFLGYLLVNWLVAFSGPEMQTTASDTPKDAQYLEL